MTPSSSGLVARHINTQRHQFTRSGPGCVLTGRTAMCPTCDTRRPALDLSSKGVVRCLTCGSEYSREVRA